MEENDKSISYGWIIGIIVLLIIIGAYVYAKSRGTLATNHPEESGQISPSPSPSATGIEIDTMNWKTYSNDKIGLTFKYPEELASNMSEEGEENSVIESPPRREHSYQHYTIRMHTGATEVHVEYFSKGAKLTYNDFLTGEWGHEKDAIYERISLDGKDATKFVYDVEKNGKGEIDPHKNIQIGVQTPNGGFYVITLSTSQVNQDFKIAIFNAFLETITIS
jgi:hypothetical protein